jgi:hypothetical protein
MNGTKGLTLELLLVLDKDIICGRKNRPVSGWAWRTPSSSPERSGQTWKCNDDLPISTKLEVVGDDRVAEASQRVVGGIALLDVAEVPTKRREKSTIFIICEVRGRQWSK